MYTLIYLAVIATRLTDKWYVNQVFGGGLLHFFINGKK